MIKIEELWKPVNNQPMYFVSNTGKVRNSFGLVLKTYVINSGYEAVKLYNKGVKSSHLIHRLVAEHFCEGYSPELTVNHKDADKLNNNADNLEWVTYKENTADVIRRGELNTYDARRNHKLTRRINQLTMDGEYIATHNSIKEAGKKLGIKSYGHITSVAQGARNSCGGFKWVYTDPEEGVKYADRSVVQLDEDFKEIKRYKSTRAAEVETGFTNLNHHFRTKETPFQYKGYYWDVG